MTTEAWLPTHCKYCRRRILKDRLSAMCYGCSHAVAAERAWIAEAVQRELDLVSEAPFSWEAGAKAAYLWVLYLLAPSEP
jgi:hypothetical protein